MNDLYLEFKFKISPSQPATDILIAELGELGFDSFLESSDGLSAYVLKEDWQPEYLHTISVLLNPEFEISYQVREIEQENWNAKWEESFDPIIVGQQCVVRAPFHSPVDTEYDIVITPKMSFGTGHHETTYMMLQFILKSQLEGKSVLDMGCGTGVLAILAAMKGATKVDAIDIDHWSYLNTLENIELNGQGQIHVKEGDSSLLGDGEYDLILANINRNILLQDIPVYVSQLKKGGNLILSGFYTADLPRISEVCEGCGLGFQENLEKNDWVSAKYVF